MITKALLKKLVERVWAPVKCNCGSAVCQTHGLNTGTFYQGSGFHSLEEAQIAAAAPLAISLLLEAMEHLEYCNYGDKWESECADAAKLPERLEAFMKQLGVGA